MCRCDTGSCGASKLEALGSVTYGAQSRIEQLVTAQADPETPNQAIERIRAELARRRATQVRDVESDG